MTIKSPRLPLTAWLVAASMGGALPTLLAAELVVRVPAAHTMDSVGGSLRRAFNGYERAAVEGLPQDWSMVLIAEGQLFDLGGDHRLLLTRTGSATAQCLHLHGSESSTLTLTTGQSTRSGDLSLILSRVGPREAQLLVRSSSPSPTFHDSRPSAGSRVRIENPAGSVLRVESSEQRDLRFADRFLREYFSGAGEDASLRAAWQAHPPVRLYTTTISPASTRPTGAYVDPTNMFGPLDDGPGDLSITLTSIQADSAAIGTINSSIAYRSDGRPGVSQSSGRVDGDGLGVQIGGPGDRFRATIQALERNGQVRSRNESMIRVPAGGRSSFQYQSANGHTSGSVATRRQGGRYRLDFNLGAGSGATSTSVQMSPGQTIMVSRFQSSRTQTSSSGPPLVGGIPYVGPLLGNSSRSSASTEWVLYATLGVD